MGQVRNGRLYLRYGSSPREMKQRRQRSLQATSPGYFIAKSTLKVPLTFNKVKKFKVENFDFLPLLSSSSSPSSITQNLYGVRKY